MTIEPGRAAVLALHWQINVIKPEGFFGGMFSEPVTRSGVIERAAGFHTSARARGLRLVFTRFVVPERAAGLVRNTDFMDSVADAQEQFRPDAPGAALIPEMAELGPGDRVFDNQKLSGLAGSILAEWLTRAEIDVLFLTGVATNLTVEQTARHGTDLGFTVYVVRDCVASADADVHEASLANLELTTAGCVSAEQALKLVSAG